VDAHRLVEDFVVLALEQASANNPCLVVLMQLYEALKLAHSHQQWRKNLDLSVIDYKGDTSTKHTRPDLWKDAKLGNVKCATQM
jgi:hypothetical protein